MPTSLGEMLGLMTGDGVEVETSVGVEDGDAIGVGLGLERSDGVSLGLGDCAIDNAPRRNAPSATRAAKRFAIADWYCESWMRKG